MKNKINYYGANQTRNSVCKNPGAYSHDQTSGLFGVREFRKFGYVSEDVQDRVADQKISGGWSKSKNKICQTCFTMKSLNGSCECE